MEPAVFRPAQRRFHLALLAGAVGGAVIGELCGLPLLAAAALGASAAAIAVGIGHATGPRLVVTDKGARALGGRLSLEGRWEELRLGFGETRYTKQRYAVLADPRGRSFAFADLAGGPEPEKVRGLDGTEVPVIDLRDAALLLALVVERGGIPGVLPDGVRAYRDERPEEVPKAAEVEASEGRPRAAPKPRVGFFGLLAKLGGVLAKALKTANLGWAAASFAAYGFIFSWKFAAALLLQLFVHEYGHVHAMRRTGMKVRGMYFIPFLGAVAVTEDSFSSRRQQAYVALNGPFWGSAFALVPLGLFLATRNPEYAGIASWWALINLFNLLPILPLDGGRLLQALAFSFSSSLGLALTVLGLAGAVVIGTVFGYGLIWLVALLGTTELLSEAQARAGSRALRLLPDPGRLGPAHFAYLRAVVGPPLGSPSEALFLRGLERMRRTARAAPLSARQMLVWGGAYAVLALTLLAAVHFLTRATGGAGPATLLS